jgi:hypothetical protein
VQQRGAILYGHNALPVRKIFANTPPTYAILRVNIYSLPQVDAELLQISFLCRKDELVLPSITTTTLSSKVKIEIGYLQINRPMSHHVVILS